MNSEDHNADQGAGGQAKQSLRLRAEDASLRKETILSPENIAALSPGEIRSMLHELLVHQIELEMQNEELRRAQDELNDARARYFDLYDLAPVSYFTVSDRGVILDANLTATTVLGLTRNQLKRRHFSQFVGSQEQNDYYLYINQLLKSGEPCAFDLQMVKDDGVSFWAHLTATVARDANGATVSRIVISDISDRKQAEAEREKLQTRLYQSQKMEAIGTLAGGIAHDLNNILFPISGLSEMLLEDFPPNSPEYEMIQQIHVSVLRGTDLVKQILAFSRQSNPEKLPLQIQPVLKEVLKLARATLPQNIEMTSLIGPDCGMVVADPTQVHQIIMNLVTNAYHAVEKTGGAIHVELKEIAKKTVGEKGVLGFNALPAGRYACISVSDTGIGIDKSMIDKIFTPYFTTKAQGKGTGLGLSVVLGIVKEHGGDIDVYSEIGKGTTFNVYVPLLEGIGNAEAAADVRQYPTGNERILLVDDEAPIVQMEQMILEKLGYRITAFTCSLEALAAFKADPDGFDLVISDRGMPKMTGEQLAKELMVIRPKIPIILCTGFSNEADEQHAGDIGVKGFLMKPVAKTDLAIMVRKVLNEK